MVKLTSQTIKMYHIHTIKQLEEKNVANEIEIMLWSDRMDIVALANTKGEVALHRLTWTRVWALAPEKEGLKVKSMSWRPDGKILAIAYSSDEVLLINVENKQPLHVIKISSPVACLEWTHEKIETANASTCLLPEDDGDQNMYLKYLDFSSTYLPEIHSLNTYNTTSSSSDDNARTNALQDQSTLNLLVIGTEDGFLHLSIFGNFTCAIINLNEYVGYRCSIIKIHFSDQLETMFVTIKNELNNVQIIAVKTEIFKTHARELFVMASKHERLSNLLDNLYNTITTITEAWENILLEMDTKLSNYAAKVPEGGVTADFLDLLMFGIYSEEIEEFLVHDLTQKGLEKFGRTIETSYASIQKLILKYVMKIGQNITYHLAELRGLARLEHRYQVLGLHEDQVTEAILSTGSFLIKTGEMQQIINDAMINYKAFFRWLYISIMHLINEPVPVEVSKMTQQDLTSIAEFVQSFSKIKKENVAGNLMRSGFMMERLGQYLVDRPLTIPTDMQNNEWTNFLKHNECVLKNSGIMKHCKDMSLIQQLKYLKSSTDNIFLKSKQLIWQQFGVKHVINCLPSPMESVAVSQVNCSTTSTFAAILWKKEPIDSVLLVNITHEADSTVIRTGHIFFSHLRETEMVNYRIIDINFYTGNVLSLLLEEDNLTRKGVLCQFPVVLISDKLTEVDPNNQNLVQINGCEVSGTTFKTIEGMNTSQFSVSGSRRVCIVLAENRKKVRLFEMEADEDDDEEADATASMVRDLDISMQDSSISGTE